MLMIKGIFMKHNKKMHPETTAPQRPQDANTITNRQQDSGKLPKENNPTTESYRDQKPANVVKEVKSSEKSEKLKEEVKNRKPGEDVDPKQSLASE
jgi:hypothetical protein